MEFITDTQILARKLFKKVEVQLDYGGLLIRTEDYLGHSESLDDLKHKLINAGYKINWDVYQKLLNLNWF